MKTGNPYADLIASIDRAIEYTVAIKVQPMNRDGDIVFTAPLDTLPWTHKSLKSPIVYTHAFANIVSEILVRSNLSVFHDTILSKHYLKCHDYRHTGFGMRVTKQEIVFQMHCSFLAMVFNDFLNNVTSEASKEINVQGEKKLSKDNLPTITSYGDDKSFKVQVAKHGDLRHTISLAISTILRHYGIAKDFHTTVNMFSIEVETSDESKAENY